MGRPFATEMQRLTKTWAETTTQDISSIVDWVAQAVNSPLMAVGSGGSLSAADFLAWLHETRTGQISRAATPFEIVRTPYIAPSNALAIISAGGRNTDVLAAAQHILAQEPRHLLVLCGEEKSPLATSISAYSWARLAVPAVSAGRDGFLATNSLVAFAHVLARAYATVFPSSGALPNNIDALKGAYRIQGKRRGDDAEFWDREHVLVLYGHATRAAAVDLESKFSEAALGSAHIADFRNFAHGRHHWLAKRGASSSVLAFVDPEDRDVALRTLELLPRGVPVLKVELSASDATAALASLLAVLELVGIAGVKRHIDPGRPGVPEFGRKLYNLGGFRRQRAASSVAAAAIRRKRVAAGDLGLGHTKDRYWETAYSTFVGSLTKAELRGLVCDYDGTLCARERRYSDQLDERIAHELRRLVTSGVLLGVATGRGRSVAIPFRNALEKKLWDRVLIGYYNGSIVAPLSKDLQRDEVHVVADELREAAQLLDADGRLLELATVEVRHKQITVTAKQSQDAESVWGILRDALLPVMPTGVQVVRSSHSFDVLAPGVSKRALLASVRERLPSRGEVLCIGDAGRWPGNDSVLLAAPLSLSVDEVSSSPAGCWNLAPSPHRGVEIAARLLAAVRVKDGVGRFQLEALLEPS